MSAAARLTVNLDALAANLAVLRALAGPAEVAPAVKADAYGLGAGSVARRLWAEGARAFYVSRVGEGTALRAALGPDRAAEIFVLDGCPDGAAGVLRAAGLTPVLNSLAQIEAYAAGAPGGPCALHVDTGMNRLGLRPEEARSLANSDRLRRLDLRWVLSHLACAGEEDRAACDGQAAALTESAALFPDARLSLANSAGLFLSPSYRFDQVRPGISLYGGGPFGRPDPRLRPVASLTAPVLQVRNVLPGERIGYGGTFTAERPVRAAIVAAGYADGVLRSASGRGYAWADGALRPLLGRVSMDLIAIDVTDAPGVRPGTEVELWGDRLPLDEAAEGAGTLAYELLTRASLRAERVTVGAAG